MQNKNLYNAVIISGGVGSRLNAHKPKILTKIGSDNFLDYIYNYLYRNNFKKIVLLGGYGSEKIISYIKEKNYNIHFIKEKNPLGTGGALIQNLKYFDKNFLVILGDVYTNLNLRSHYKVHCKSKVAATILAHSNDHPQDSNLIIKNQSNYLEKVLPKGHKTIILENLVFSGIYFFSRNFLTKLKFNKSILDLESNIIKSMVNKRFYIKIKKFFNFLIDFGTKKRIAVLRKIVKKKINFEENLKIFQLTSVDINKLKILSSLLKIYKFQSTNFLLITNYDDLLEEKKIIKKIDSFLSYKKVMVNEIFFIRQKIFLKKISKKFKYIKIIKI